MAKAKSTLNAADIKLLKTFLPTREEFEELKFDVSHLPTRDEFYTMMDALMGELKGIREEIAIVVGKSSHHEDRITNLEDDMKIVQTKLATV